MRGRRPFAAAAILGLLAGCATAPPPAKAPPAPPAAAAPIVESGGALRRPGARWVPVGWNDLPGFSDDRVAEAGPALRAGCARPAPGWEKLCARALREFPAGDEEARRWLLAELQPYRVESLDGSAEGLATGYYEPTFDAARRAGGAFRVPLYAPPADLATRKPYWTRQQLDTLPEARAALRGREIAFLADPLDALVLQIQGSGRLRITEPDGRVRNVRLSFAGTNEQPYRSVGGWLIEKGELRPGAASWPQIKTWAQKNPGRVQEMLWANPRVVFFREEALADPAQGPRGAQGVPLTPGRSIAVDPRSIPYGTPVWLDTTEPLSAKPLRRLVLAQDTGSAITGAVRADYFWGAGSEAETQAGRMKQPLRMWVLWPRGVVGAP